MKVGILGSGFMGGTHARAYAKMKGVEVVAISSLHLEKAETLANEVGGRATTDNLAIIDDPSIDAISNTLPTHLHAEYTIAALKACLSRGSMCSWRSRLRSPPLAATV
jgi:UDP-N-acetylglucosamine 3-dehydrogenase